MTVTVNASTSAGVVVTSDTSGALALQTGGTTALTVTSAQKIGVGTASPQSTFAVSGSGYQGGSLQIIRTDTTSSWGIGGDTANALQFYDITAGNLTRMAIDGNGNVALAKNIAVGNATPTTSGTGITFPASQSASSNANTLDDYEEGTWSPVLTSISGTLTSVANGTGYYIKIGNLVTITCKPVITTNGTGAGALQIAGFPFASSPADHMAGAGRELNATGLCYSFSGNSSTSIYIQQYNSTYLGGNGYAYAICLTYITA